MIHNSAPRSNPNIFKIDSETKSILERISLEMPSPNLNGPYLQTEILKTYRKRLLQIPKIVDLKKRLNEDVKTTENARGYCVVDGLLDKNEDIEDIDMRIPTAICSLVGVPMQPYLRWSLWKDLFVDTEVEPKRFRGTGYNNFHIDLVNTKNPPDCFVLFSIRSDPAGGGQTIISNFQDAVQSLKPEEIRKLSNAEIVEGKFIDIEGVDGEYRPFPVLKERGDGLWQVRFTAKVISDLKDSDLQEVMRKFEEILIEGQEVFTLKKGQLIIGNQTVVGHGRLPLGDDQEEIQPHKRRLLYQSSIRFND